MKLPCYQHDKHHRECSSCVEMNRTQSESTRTPNESSRVRDEAMRNDLVMAFRSVASQKTIFTGHGIEELAESVMQLFARHAAHIRTQERERAAKIAENPYGDEVQAYGYDEPKAVGRKIAAAIREG